MKDNLNIEELFKEKFNSFEGEVSPDAWGNIQQGIGAAGSTTAAAGMSLLTKTIIAGGIIAATVVGVYMASDSDVVENNEETIISLNDNNASEVLISDENSTNDIVLNPTDLEDRVEGEQNDIQDNSDEAGDNSEVLTEEGTSEPMNNIEPVMDLSGSGDQTNNEENGVDNDATEEGFGENPNQNDDLVDDVVKAPEDTDAEGDEKENIPSGTFVFEAGNQYAPSTYSFEAEDLVNYAVVKWEFGDGETAVGESVEHTFEKPGDYDVKMIVKGSDNSFEATQKVTIESKSSIGKIPNIITPNGDHINDFAAINTKEIETFFITIQDKNGKTVFETTDRNFRWGGTDQGGNQLEKGRYTYMLIAVGTDGAEFKIRGQIYIK